MSTAEFLACIRTCNRLKELREDIVVGGVKKFFPGTLESSGKWGSSAEVFDSDDAVLELCAAGESRCSVL